MNVLDIFAGVGGWDLALGSFGLTSLGLEIDRITIETRTVAALPTQVQDVATFNPVLYQGHVQGLVGSPPCPALSQGGNHRGHGDRANLIRVIKAFHMGYDIRHAAIPHMAHEHSLLSIEPLRYALAIKPHWIALEQVPAILPIWRAIAAVLRANHYNTWVGHLEASDFGVPQMRRRCFMLASRSAHPKAPLLTHLSPRTPAEVLGWDPTDRIGYPRFADRYQSSIILNGLKYRDRDLRSATRPIFTMTKWAESWMRINSATERMPVTIAEANQIQGFPAQYPVHGSRGQAFKQISNAVPPPLARAVLSKVLL